MHTDSALQTDDKVEWTAGATYAMGAFTMGYQFSVEDEKSTTIDYYENSAFGVSFNVNDNLTLSYNNYKSDKTNVGSADVELEASSIQLAYTMGGMSIRVADGEVDNATYSTTAVNQKDGRVVSVSLAF
jgi:hypothetical protein